MENSPNCLAEAMLLGVPCVASNVGGVSDILAPEQNGILYDGNNPVKLAEAIKEMFRMTDEKDERLYGMLERSRTDAAFEKHNGDLNCKTSSGMYQEIYKTIGCQRTRKLHRNESNLCFQLHKSPSGSFVK